MGNDERIKAAALQAAIIKQGTREFNSKRDYRPIAKKPVFYKKPLLQRTAFYALVTIATTVVAGVFYYGF